MDHQRKLPVKHVVDRRLCRPIARFSVIVVLISAVVSWNVISGGGCAERGDPIRTFAAVTLFVAGVGLVLVLISIVSLHVILFFDSATSKVTECLAKLYYKVRS